MASTQEIIGSGEVACDVTAGVWAYYDRETCLWVRVDRDGLRRHIDTAWPVETRKRSNECFSAIEEATDTPWLKFDGNVYQIPLHSGLILDTQTSNVRPRTREDMCTWALPIASSGDPSLAAAFVEELAGPEQATVLQRFVGQCLLGAGARTPSNLFIIGGTSTGKTTFLNLVNKLLHPICVPVDLDTLPLDGSFAIQKKHAAGKHLILAYDPRSLPLEAAELLEATRANFLVCIDSGADLAREILTDLTMAPCVVHFRHTFPPRPASAGPFDLDALLSSAVAWCLAGLAPVSDN